MVKGENGEGVNKQPAQPAPRNSQAGRFRETNGVVCVVDLAETEFDAKGPLRELPLLEDRVAAQNAAGTALEAASTVKADRAVVSLFVEIGGASLHKLAEFFAIGFVAKHDVCIFFINKELILAELLVHIDELDFLRAHSAFPQP